MLHILKKRESIIALSFLFVFLTSCASKTYIPTVQTEFETKAKYTFGDFTYNCKITKTENFVTVEILDTKAAGLVIKCDGERVYFILGDTVRDNAVGEVDVTNPALILYQVFFSLNSAVSSVIDGGCVLSGTCGAGNYALTLSKAGDFKNLSLPSAGIVIDFYI